MDLLTRSYHRGPVLSFLFCVLPPDCARHLHPQKLGAANAHAPSCFPLAFILFVFYLNRTNGARSFLCVPSKFLVSFRVFKKPIPKHHCRSASVKKKGLQIQNFCFWASPCKKIMKKVTPKNLTETVLSRERKGKIVLETPQKTCLTSDKDRSSC